MAAEYRPPISSATQAAITAEATTRATADTALSAADVAEATARANADSAEVTARIAADTTLTAAVGLKASTAALTTETNARIAADETLTTAVQTLELTVESERVQDEGVVLPKRTNLNFLGVGASVIDDAASDRLIISVPGVGLNVKDPRWGPGVPYNHGAIADGSAHPLSGFFASLAAAQAVYPHATSLADELDWAVIVKAIQALPINKGGVLKLPTGIYLTNQQIVFDRPVQMYGDGIGLASTASAATLIRPAAGVGGIRVGAGAENSAARGSIISGLSLYSRSTAAGMDNGLEVLSPDVTIERVIIRNFGRWGFYSGGGVSTGLGLDSNTNMNNYRHVACYDNRSDGFRFEYGNVQYVENCNGDNNGGWGFYLAQGAKNTYICLHANSNTLGAYYVGADGTSHVLIGLYSESASPLVIDGHYCIVLQGFYGNPPVTNNGTGNVILDTGKWNTVTTEGGDVRLRTSGDVLIDAGQLAFGVSKDAAISRPQANQLAMGANDTFVTGKNTTANRPSAATMGSGAQFYDSTLKRPIWSDGAAWMAGSGRSADVVADKGYVNHGATAGTARPSGYASVEWVGSVEPTNAVDGDTWVNTS